MKNKTPSYVLLSFAIVAASSIQINAQSIERQSISSYGSSTTLDGITIQQSIGQPYSTVSYTDGQITVNPGFQQSTTLYSILQDDLLGQNLQLTVYPNPVVNSLSIEIPADLNATSVVVTDLSGRILSNEQVTESGQHSINCAEWPTGLYLIKLVDNIQNVYSAKFIINK